MNKNCQEGNHTFERDEFNKNRFVCTHCGAEKDISIQPPKSSNTPLLFAVVLFIIYLITTINQPQEPQLKKPLVERPNNTLKDVN